MSTQIAILMRDIREVNEANGWYDETRPFSADIALLHSEVSEAFEAYRDSNWTGEKDSVQDEMADIFIRLLDTCDRYNIDLVKQTIAKLAVNRSRGKRHGGKIV